MKEDSVVSIEEPTTNKDVLTEVLREGAQKLLAEAVQAELEELLEEYREERDGEGRQRAWCATATCLGERSRRGLEGSRFGCLGFGIVGRARSLKRSFAFVLAWCRPI